MRFDQNPDRPKPEIPRGYRVFWESLLSTGSPLVVFSNNEFVQRPDGSLLEVMLSENARKSGPTIVDLTGIGEVVAVRCLERFFNRCGVEAGLRRALAARPEELSTRNVIYVGSPFTNRRLRAMLATIWEGHQERFVFRESSTAPYVSLIDTDQHRRFDRHDLTPDGSTWRDYALVSRMRKPHGKVDLVLAGTSTFGTQAATAFVCDATRLQDLLGPLDADSLACLQVVLEVKVVDGEPVEIRIMTEAVATHRCG